MTGGRRDVEADIQAKLADEARGEVRLLRSGSMTTPNASVDRLINGAYGSPERLRDAAALLGEDEQEALALLTRERSVTGARSCPTPRDPYDGLMTTVTVDTNGLDSANIALLQAAARGRDIVFAAVTVSERELRDSDIRVPVSQIIETAVWDESPWETALWAKPVNEVLIIGESPIGKAILGDTSDRFEFILKVISNGSFPKPGQRDNLTANQRRQLRDAMIFEAHVRDGRDIFVSNDEKAFVGKTGEARLILEGTFGTRIMTIGEFCTHAAAPPTDG